MKNILKILFFAFLGILLSSWGRVGHRVIAEKSGESFTGTLSPFSSWATFIAAHSSDPDTRKSSDPSEGPKHYIDIDNYSEFVSTGKISQNFDEIVASHGESFVYDQGILPWATLATYDSLKNCLARHAWDKAKVFASDLSHYVADGHMPLHITRNYDGKFTANNGIHSRYESVMVNAYENAFSYTAGAPRYISNRSDFIFNYLYSNYAYADSVLAADNYAREKAGNTSSNEYTTYLWGKTGRFTINLFSQASSAYNSLLYSAWADAGFPSFDSSFAGETPMSALFKAVYPNPACDKVIVEFSVSERSKIAVEITDSIGKRVKILANEWRNPGNYTEEWKTGKNKGAYFITLKTKNQNLAKRVIVLGN